MTDKKTETVKVQSQKSGFRRLGIERYFLLIVTLLLVVFFSVMQPRFFSVDNLLNIVSNACLIGIVGVGVTCIFAAGEMDFSAANQFTFAATLLSQIILVLGVRSYLLAVLMTMAALICVGLFNAFLHVKVGIPAFIATMGTSFLVRGISKGICNGINLLGVSAGIGPIFTVLGQSYLFGVIPMPVVCLLVVGTFMLIYTEKTRGGKYMYAVGTNPAACKYIGINASLQKVKGFVLCSVCCCLAGIIQSSMISGATQTMGDNMMLSAITVLMLGATFLKIGVFNVPGTIVGALLIAIMANGLTMMNASTATKEIFQGIVLFVAVTVVSIAKLKMKRVKKVKKGG